MRLSHPVVLTRVRPCTAHIPNFVWRVVFSVRVNIFDIVLIMLERGQCPYTIDVIREKVNHRLPALAD